MNVVLVVDDNAAIRMVISDFLSFTFDQVRVLQAVDGVEGMKLVQTEKPDLILLDAEMPNMNGLEVAQQLKLHDETRQIPIVAISSGASNNPIVSGLREMSDAILPKPFTPDELTHVVGEIVPSTKVIA